MQLSTQQYILCFILHLKSSPAIETYLSKIYARGLTNSQSDYSKHIRSRLCKIVNIHIQKVLQNYLKKREKCGKNVYAVSG